MNTPKTYKIKGMHCASCAGIIEKTFKKISEAAPKPAASSHASSHGAPLRATQRHTPTAARPGNREKSGIPAPSATQRHTAKPRRI